MEAVSITKEFFIAQTISELEGSPEKYIGSGGISLMELIRDSVHRTVTIFGALNDARDKERLRNEVTSLVESDYMLRILQHANDLRATA